MSTSERRLHERALELAATALDFRLGGADAAALEAHLAACPACARRAAALRADTAALRGPVALLPSRRVDDAVYAAIAGRDPRPASQRLLVLVAATALLLVALLGVAAAGAFILDSWPFRTSLVVDPSPGPSASPGPEVSSLTWRLGEVPPMFEGGTAVPVAVTASGDGFVAVGGREFRDTETPSGGTGSAWLSADGLTWQPATSTADLAVGDVVPLSGPTAGLVDVAHGADGYVAVGIVLQSNDVIGSAWRSADGRTWTRIDLPDSALARPTAVTWNGSTYIIVGVVEAEGAPRAAAWVSADGRSWRRVSDTEAFDVGGYRDTGEHRSWDGPADVTALPDGSLVAVGRTCAAPKPNDTFSCSPFVVRSADGDTWSAVPVPDATGFSVVLASVAATSTHVVAVSGGEGAGVVVWDEAGWRQVERRGEPPLRRVVAFHDGFLALSTDGNAISLWTSPDGETWASVPGIPQPPDVTVLRDVDLAVAGDQVVIVGWAEVSSAAGMSAFSIVGSPQQPQAPAVSPSPAPPAIGKASLPVASGDALVAPGPDGGSYVVVSTGRDGTAARPNDRSVLALLDADGSPRSGWPIAIDGWYCESPTGEPTMPQVADDGSVTVVCRSSGDAEGSTETGAFRFDGAGRLVASWSYPGEASGNPRVVDDRLLVVASKTTEGVDGSYTAEYWLDEVAPDGSLRSGVRMDLGDAGWPVTLGPDGIAYHSDMAGGVITAFDRDGQRAGWPVRLGGSLSALGFGTDGRVFVTVTSAGETRLVVLEGDGRIASSSDPLPVDGAIAYSGAGPGGRPMAPLVSPDGTAFIVAESDGHALVYGIAPSGAVMVGWPYEAPTAPEWQGSCPPETTGCGVWRAVPAIGPDGTVYLPLAAPDAQIGGTLAAVGPGGKDLAGWPMHLARRGSEWWAVAPGIDGTAFALAVEPETGGSTSATIVAIARDGSVRFRTTVVDPKAAE